MLNQCTSINAVKLTSHLLLLCSQLSAAEQEAKNEEPAMDLSATFRNSMRHSMNGATPSSMLPSTTYILFCIVLKQLL